ncbi:hypothetical protein LQW54_002076 [Pestalotiopsis sp. IQ-011]
MQKAALEGEAANCRMGDAAEEPSPALSALGLGSTAVRQITDRDFITERAVGEEPDGDLLGPVGHSPQQDEAPNDPSLDYIDPTLLFPCDSDIWLDNLDSTEEQGLLGAFLSPLPSPDLLSARLELLGSQLAAHAGTWRMSFDHDLFRHFFSLSNVNAFAMTFCRKRHYQFTLIHWPTFSLEDTSLPLLIAVALTGATYSFHSENGSQHIGIARRFYQLADSYVFHRLKTYADNDPASVVMTEAVEACQAGILMYGINELQRGNSAVHFTTNSERLPALAAAMRRLHLIDCRHDPLEDWPLFLQREHIIRLVSWTYCADCLATLTYNKPPIFSLLEMTGDLPCDPTLWDGDPNMALEAMKSSQPVTSRCIKDLTSQLLRGTVNVDGEWDSIPLFHLQAVMCGKPPSKPRCFTKAWLVEGANTMGGEAIQHVIFNHHVTLSLASQSANLLKALETWRRLSNRATDQLSENHRKYIGVARHVPGIAYLCKRIIEVSVGPAAGSSRYLQRVPSYTALELHEFIKEFVPRS